MRNWKVTWYLPRQIEGLLSRVARRKTRAARISLVFLLSNRSGRLDMCRTITGTSVIYVKRMAANLQGVF